MASICRFVEIAELLANTNLYNNAIGIAEIIIHDNCLLGTSMPKFFNLITVLRKKNKKFDASMATPTPVSPIFGIKYNVKRTFEIPDINLIINVIQVLLAK